MRAGLPSGRKHESDFQHDGNPKTTLTLFPIAKFVATLQYTFSLNYYLPSNLIRKKSLVQRTLSEVFQTVGLPKYTYVKPPYFGEVRADIELPGKHLLIEGPSGIGKSCVVYKVFEEIGWSLGTHFHVKSCREHDAYQVISEFLANAMAGETAIKALFADDFHILTEEERAEIGSRLKQLSDKSFEQEDTPKLILVGIPAAGSSILRNSQDLGPRLGIYRIHAADNREIEQLIDDGELELNVLIEDHQILLSESAGNFWLAQFICNKICAIAGIYQTQTEVKILEFDLNYIRQRLLSELSNRFMPVATTFSKGKKWRPGGNKPYLEVLLALAKIPDLVIPFDSLLSVVPDHRKPGLRAIRPRIKEVIFNPSKGIDLRKQIAFEETYFSIEDPLFRYFLTNFNESDLYKELGTKKEFVEVSQIYSYDVGFSFAGEVRDIVECANTLLKAEDIITFYDFDQQAFLLAENLEEVLANIYAESCRYYLVFIDSNYVKKIWTRFERDILTHSSRAKHIIPVILDPEELGKVVGIPSTIGMVDLSKEWGEVMSIKQVSDTVRSGIRDKLALPLASKLEELAAASSSA